MPASSANGLRSRLWAVGSTTGRYPRAAPALPRQCAGAAELFCLRCWCLAASPPPGQ